MSRASLALSVLPVTSVLVVPPRYVTLTVPVPAPVPAPAPLSTSDLKVVVPVADTSMPETVR